MRTLIVATGILMFSNAFAAESAGDATKPMSAPNPNDHVYLVERHFPAGALDGVDDAAKKQINATNASVGATWIHSFANADKTKTYCVYAGPNPDSIREAAKLNHISADVVTEIPVEIPSGTGASAIAPPTGSTHRFVVERTFDAGTLAKLTPAAKRKINESNGHYGVQWLTAYASADKTHTFWIYDAPNEAAVRKAATESGSQIVSVMEIPVTLLPK